MGILLSGMKTQSRSQIMNGLKKKIPKLWMKKSEEWGSVSGNIITTSEQGEESYYNGIPAFDYYEEADYLMREEGFESSTYDGGIQTKLVEWLKERGWYGEWNDAGTLVLSKW